MSSVRFVVVVTIVILGVGILLDLMWPDVWFQRSGALLVAFTIVIFIVDGTLGKLIVDDFLDSDRRSSGAQKALRDISIENISDETRASVLALFCETKKIIERYETFINRIEQTTRRKIGARGKFLKTEGWLLVLGTLVWGFGDMIIGGNSCFQ